MTCTHATTIGEIVAADYRAAGVFERHGLDFCCRGGRSLKDACRDAAVSIDAVVLALEALDGPLPADLPRYDDWSLPALIDHIVTRHHAYVRQSLPALLTHSRKIAQVHGAKHRELGRVAELVEMVAAEMTSHMMKEENILFPFIVALATARQDGRSAPLAPFGTVTNPIHMMEAEHESAGNALFEIRELTDGYSVPPDACRTYTVCLKELEAFEQDLHTHVHLENNILFPKAAALERLG
jgi:regulator of cell morphogenesis and NO signaling